MIEKTSTKKRYRIVMSPKDSEIAFVIKRNYGTEQRDFYTYAYSEEQAAHFMRIKHPMWKVEHIIED